MFKADETLQAQSSIRLRPSHIGHDIVNITTGGIESQGYPDNEATPLLAEENGKSGARPTDIGGDNERAEQHWSGDKDFEGRPWWNKPLVGCTRTRRSNLC